VLRVQAVVAIARCTKEPLDEAEETGARERATERRYVKLAYRIAAASLLIVLHLVCASVGSHLKRVRPNCECGLRS
jgi:hypothetical protein